MKRKKKIEMKKEQGVTLVALVVTIIVLIILAGVSINLIIGDNGIITIAKKARENTELARIEEETSLNELYSQISSADNESTSYEEIEKLVEFKKIVASAITDMGIPTSEQASADTMASNIKSIIGTTTSEKVKYDNTNSKLDATNVQEALDELDSSLKYSNEEVKVGTWTDGKAIYRKVVNTSQIYSISTSWVDIGIKIEDCDNLIYANDAYYPNLFAFKCENNILYAISSYPAAVIGNSHSIIIDYTKK